MLYPFRSTLSRNDGRCNFRHFTCFHLMESLLHVCCVKAVSSSTAWPATWSLNTPYALFCFLHLLSLWFCLFFLMHFTILTLTQVSSIHPASLFSEGWSNRAKVKTFCLGLTKKTKTNPAETFRLTFVIWMIFFFFFASSSLAIELINYVALKMFIWSFSSPFISEQFGRDWTICFTTENFLF